jgi:hypothetical protein
MTIRSYCIEEKSCDGCGQVLTSAYVRWQLLNVQLNFCVECAISTGSGIKRDGNKIRDIAENDTIPIIV